MNANTEIDLAELHAAIIADIQAQFPDLQTVEFYREDRKGLVTPACLIELAEMEAEPDIDPGTEQLAVTARFEAEIIIGFRTANAKLAIRQLAAAFAAWLRLRRWASPENEGLKLPTGPAQVVGCYRDDFNPELDQYEVWRVEWLQVLHLGSTVWSDAGYSTPTTVFLSQPPEIGEGHDDDYDQVYPI